MVTTRRAPVNSISWLFMIKYLEKGDNYLSLLRVAHSFFIVVDITCGVRKKLERNIVK